MESKKLMYIPKVIPNIKTKERVADLDRYLVLLEHLCSTTPSDKMTSAEKAKLNYCVNMLENLSAVVGCFELQVKNGTINFNEDYLDLLKERYLNELSSANSGLENRMQFQKRNSVLYQMNLLLTAYPQSIITFPELLSLEQSVRQGLKDKLLWVSESKFFKCRQLQTKFLEEQFPQVLEVLASKNPPQNFNEALHLNQSGDE